MRQLGDTRLEALALDIVERLAGHPALSVRDRGHAVQAVTMRLRSAFQVDPELDRAARERIRSLSRSVPEGSREWDMLYRQYIDELSHRRR